MIVTHEIRATDLKHRLDLASQHFYSSKMLKDSLFCFNYSNINSLYFSALTKPYSIGQITKVE